MPISNYPNGFANGVAIRNMPITITNPGNVFWVDSGSGSNGFKGTHDRPFGTIDYAIGRCTASNGDIIFVKPGHAETISAAGGIDMDVAGVAIVGLGRGTLRPTITLGTAATADFDIAAANCMVHNLRFVANFADIVKIIDVTATDAHIDSCEFVEGGADLNWLDVIDASGADNTADGLTVTNCRAMGVDAGCDSFIEITGDIDRLTVQDNYVVSRQRQRHSHDRTSHRQGDDQRRHSAEHLPIAENLGRYSDRQRRDHQLRSGRIQQRHPCGYCGRGSC